MRGYVGNTDYEWLTYLRSIDPPVDEVNFWRPRWRGQFRALDAGEPFFFRLKSPRNVIGGFAHFAHSSFLPTRLAWSVYQEANGAPTYATLRRKLAELRGLNEAAAPDGPEFSITCILLTAPVFFDERDWIPAPQDFGAGIQQGKGYDLLDGEGERLWRECLVRAAGVRITNASSIADLPLPGGYGTPTAVRPRLGQRSFRIAVLDAYERRCAVTTERALPALEAAHIRDFHDVQEHSLSNGILLRADLHNLFDEGYVTVTPEYRFEVSNRIKEDFDNGREYFKLHGTAIRIPRNEVARPSIDALSWHNEHRFLA